MGLLSVFSSLCSLVNLFFYSFSLRLRFFCMFFFGKCLHVFPFATVDAEFSTIKRKKYKTFITKIFLLSIASTFISCTFSENRKKVNFYFWENSFFYLLLRGIKKKSLIKENLDFFLENHCWKFLFSKFLKLRFKKNFTNQNLLFYLK